MADQVRLPEPPRPGPDPGQAYIQGSSEAFSVLAVLHSVAGLFCLFIPYAVGKWFFATWYVPEDGEYEVVTRLLGSFLLLGAATFFSLKAAASRGLLASHPSAHSNLLALTLWSLTVVILHIVYIWKFHTLSFWGFVLGASVMAPTLLVASSYLGMAGGMHWERATHGWSRTANTVSGMFMGANPVVAVSSTAGILAFIAHLAGLVILFFPRHTLNWTFAHVAGSETVFLWQCYGAGLLFLVPSTLYTLLEASAANELKSPIPQTVNSGLTITTIIHLVAYAIVLWSAGLHGSFPHRWLMVVLTVHWVITLLACVGVLAFTPSSSGSGYEPLINTNV